MTDERPGPRQTFRWQALLQRASGAVFVLDRRRRLLFANAAWEQLTHLSLDRARGLHCRHARPLGPDASLEERVAHALTPPPEVAQGLFGRARRLFSPLAPSPPSAVSAAQWWDVEFFPIAASGRDPTRTAGHLILGRVLPVPQAVAAGPALLPERIMALRQRRAEHYSLGLLASQAAEMHLVVRQVRLAAESNVPVLFTGEPGVGKQTAARVLHQLSAARERPFVALDGARLPAGLLARALRADAVRGHGTLYLREPGALPRELQQLLAEWLAQGAAGATGLPRLVAGCSRPPREEVAAGRLLDALYWGLAALEIVVPPLRLRRDDLAALAAPLLEGADGDDRPASRLSAATLEVLRDYSWPGNLTELRQVLTAAREKATGEEVTPEDLPWALRVVSRLHADGKPAALRPIQLEEVMQTVERRLIELALRRAEGNHRLAAELLGLTRARLLRRLEALSPSVPDAPEGPEG